MTSRQELYDRIRESSKDEVILDEMVRLGFWPRQGELPHDPADEIKRKGELERTLRALATENRRLEDVEIIKQELRKRRMQESRERRHQTKQRRLRQREERADAWRQRQQTEITYLGHGFSASLGNHESDLARLGDLPQLNTPADVAREMGISVGELRFLAFHRDVSTTTHYRQFDIRKKTGGLRRISAPMPRLKRAQQWILTNILEPPHLHDAAHGFRRGRSIVSNATPHVGAGVVVNLDVQNFFPTITYRRIRGVFRRLGYSESVATVLALLCSQPQIDEVRLDGRTYYVASGARFLPQGAPTSPAITNLICRGLDARLRGIAEQLGFVYTRYADDVTFSGSGAAADNVGRALRRIRYVIREEGFEVHPAKTRVLRRGARQEVTGLTVNDKVAVPRSDLRRFRAVLFQIERDGPQGKHWGPGGETNVMESIEGYANFVAMVDPERGGKFQAQVAQIRKRYPEGRIDRNQRQRWQPKASQTVTAPAAASTPGRADANRAQQSRPTEEAKKPWWKFW